MTPAVPTLGRMPSVPQAARLAWSDLRRVAATLGHFAGIAYAAMFAGDIIQKIVDDGGFSTRALLIAFIVGLAQAFLLTPYLIAVHRFIILGEVTPRYALATGEPRFQVFFAWSIALSTAGFAPLFLVNGLGLTEGVAAAAVAVVTVLIVMVALRLTILLPAVAVDAPGVTLRNAMADTKGHAWRILLIGLLAVFPLAVIAIILDAVVAGSTGLTVWTVIAATCGAAVGLAMLTLMVIIASRLYEWLGHRLKGAE